MKKTCHENGCSKQPTFNKARKTNGKFCGEHKKEGMISIMYKHYNNQADQVFMRLPRALQWEILVDFVGGYAVRYNRLRRLMSGDLQEQIMEHNFGLNRLSLCNLWAKPLVESPLPCNLLMYALNHRNGEVFSFRSDGQPWHDDGDPERLRAVASAEFSHRDTFVVLFASKETGQLSYGYKSQSRQWYITEVNDSVTLLPYEKRVYPSYPYTNKKLGRPVLTMKLHDPIPEVPSGLEYKEIKAWKEGRRFR